MVMASFTDLYKKKLIPFSVITDMAHIVIYDYTTSYNYSTQLSTDFTVANIITNYFSCFFFLTLG